MVEKLKWLQTNEMKQHSNVYILYVQEYDYYKEKPLTKND